MPSISYRLGPLLPNGAWPPVPFGPFHAPATVGLRRVICARKVMGIPRMRPTRNTNRTFLSGIFMCWVCSQSALVAAKHINIFSVAGVILRLSSHAPWKDLCNAFSPLPTDHAFQRLIIQSELQLSTEVRQRQQNPERSILSRHF